MALSEREHRIGLFDELVCRGAGTVHLASGPDPRLLVVGPEDYLRRVVVRYRGPRLVVSFRMGPDPTRFLGHSPDQVRTVVVTDAVSRVVVQGVADLVFGEGEERPFTFDSATIISSSSGRISGSISARECAVKIRGMGGAQLSGDVGFLATSISGIGSLDGMDLVCRRAKVSLSGVGGCKLMVLDELAATLNGTGRLSYRGTATLTTRGGARTNRVDHVG